MSCWITLPLLVGGGQNTGQLPPPGAEPTNLVGPWYSLLPTDGAGIFLGVCSGGHIMRYTDVHYLTFIEIFQLYSERNTSTRCSPSLFLSKVPVGKPLARQTYFG